LPQGKDSSPREAICSRERQVALSKFSCLKERMCWWIVFEIILCILIENIVFPSKAPERRMFCFLKEVSECECCWEHVGS
jgi:hypothetical protein